MKTKALLSMAAMALSGFATTSHAALGDLSLIPYVSYGDGRSFSLPIAELICQNNFGGAFGGVNCTDYRVPSTPGHIQDLVVIATGAEGKNVTTNPLGMDNAYSTPSGKSGSIYFAPDSNTAGVGTSRGVSGAVANNDTTTWDTSLSALKAFLADGANDPIFFFNNNQTNSTTSTDQHLAAWARLWITDAAGKIVKFASGADTLLLANRTPINGAPPDGCIPPPLVNGIASPYAIVPNGGGCPSVFDANNTDEFIAAGTAGTGPDSGTNAATDYVLSGGRVCLDANFVPVPCDGSGGAIVYNNIDHNLGADTVAYAIIFPELNAALDALFAGDVTGYTFHLDVRLGCDQAATDPDCLGRSLNNGYEQLFLASTQVPTGTPEPGTLALLGGILGVWAVSRRFRKVAR